MVAGLSDFLRKKLNDLSNYRLLDDWFVFMSFMFSGALLDEV